MSPSPVKSTSFSPPVWPSQLARVPPPGPLWTNQSPGSGPVSPAEAGLCLLSFSTLGRRLPALHWTIFSPGMSSIMVQRFINNPKHPREYPIYWYYGTCQQFSPQFFVCWLFLGVVGCVGQQLILLQTWRWLCDFTERSIKWQLCWEL